MQVSKPRHHQRQKGQRRAEHREHWLPETLTGEEEIDPHRRGEVRPAHVKPGGMRVKCGLMNEK
jgi:hypothetical protein